MTTPKQPEATLPTVDELRDAMKADRLAGWSLAKQAVKDEHAAVKAATPQGEKVPDPAGPIATWMATPEYKELRDARQSTDGGEPRVRHSRSEPKATYTRGDKPLSASHDTLSYMAYACTRKILSDDSDRMGVKEFKALLATKGITDPEHTTWETTLPNGVKVGAVMPIDQAAAASVDKKAAAKAKIASAGTIGAIKVALTEAVALVESKKVPAAKKAAGSRPPVDRKTVTPRPKTGTAKAAGSTKKASTKVA